MLCSDPQGFVMALILLLITLYNKAVYINMCLNITNKPISFLHICSSWLKLNTEYLVLLSIVS